MIIFLLGLAILLWYSYLDLKFQEVSNKQIIILCILSLITLIFDYLTNKSNIFSIIIITALTFGLCYILWTIKSIGGADVKIIPLLIPIMCFGSPNNYFTAWIFIILLGLIGLLYGLTFKAVNQINKIQNIGIEESKKANKSNIDIPFLPAITLTYIFLKVFILISFK